MPPHKKGDRVQAFCGPRLHEAKVLDVDPRNRGRGKPTYRVSTYHYVTLAWRGSPFRRFMTTLTPPDTFAHSLRFVPSLANPVRWDATL